MQKNDIRDLFPILKEIVYLDNSALVQKPISVIEKSNEFYLKKCVSNRTSNSKLGNETYSFIKEVRQKIASLIDCESDEIIFTSGTTDSLNKIALMSESLIEKDDQILINLNNHSSNIAPWITIANKKEAKIITCTQEDIFAKITSKTKIVAISQMNNAFLEKLDLKKLYKICKEKNILLINDAAQAIVHEKVSLKYSDVIAFSSNKFYGPTGLGILAIKKELLNKLTPAFSGGGSIARIIDKKIIYQPNIIGFESGTLNLCGIYMFNESLNFFKTIGYQKTQEIIEELSAYTFKRLKEIKTITVYNQSDSPIILFSIKNVDSQDIAYYLGTKNIYVRSGTFCVPLIKENSKINDNKESFVRISLGIYNNKNDIDKLIEALKTGGDFLAI
ncbi:aminotransferase class V-fold PLP-dependent enzyme [Mycoplasmopsis hyopharyngis]|uniref:aminotransferase class V-fold PLP-dependent enzyme n=1 Tax=Mycoplasmopsis hyopharyngis TaxID=29558 RepID=UPI00387378CA